MSNIWEKFESRSGVLLTNQLTRQLEAASASARARSQPFFGFRVAQSLADIKATANGTIGVGQADFDASSLQVDYDAYFFTDHYEVLNQNGFRFELRKATGIQLSLTVSKAQASISASFATVAASADAGVASAKHDFKALGETSEDFTSALPLPGKLNSEALAMLREGSRKAFVWLSTREDLGSKVESVSTPLGVDATDDAMLVAQSVVYAMNRLKKGWRLGQALAENEEDQLGLDGQIIRATYGQVTGDYSDLATTSPSGNAKDEAADWLKSAAD